MSLNTFSPALYHTQGKSLPGAPTSAHVAVVGAGAFGGWTALWLLRKGFKVTLIDAWGPGNARSSSGDETRVIRSTYGANRLYFDLNERAYDLWLHHAHRTGKKLLFNTGVLWLCHAPHNALVEASLPFARDHGRNFEYLSPAELRHRYPILNTENLDHAWFDPKGGYVLAREATLSVYEAFVREGGTYIMAQARPKVHTSKVEALYLSNGEKLTASYYIFACGAWLGELFPDILASFITCTRQEVYYFGVPADQTQAYENFPVWIDADGKDFYYGIPANKGRGFKVGVDIRGPVFNPTSGNRLADAEVLAGVQRFLSRRFPGLKNAPVLENRVCPYENSPDGNFLFDQHPHLENVLLLGGGSGHGFKHGPALGELVAQVLCGEAAIPEGFLYQQRTPQNKTASGR
jgi:glycine/D-amino acid oxidase-like deaminating enzyme